MSKFGCPDKFVAMVRQFHDGMRASVQDDGEHAASFPVTKGVKQGCILAPTLFSMVFSAMLNDAYREGKVGVDFRDHFWTDGKLFNLRRLQAKTEVTKDTAQDFLLLMTVPSMLPTNPTCSGVWNSSLQHVTTLDLQILHISWQDYIPDTEVLEQSGMESIFNLFCRC